MENILWIGGIVGLAAAVQSLAGFGFALVAIALLPFFLDLQVAVPLVLVMSLASSLSLWLYYWDSFNWKAIAPLALSALVSIPIGLAGLHYVPEEIARKLLGSFIVLYVGYDILRLMVPMFSPPALDSPYWAYVFGGMSGLLTGALTTGGPPLVMYANSKEWSPAEFKGNLPGVYVVAIAFALAGHYFEGHLTFELWQIALWSAPLFIVGTTVGIMLSNRIDTDSFKRIILSLLGMIGLKLIW